ncbi:unnamed protein product, partial [Tetraodon nigroviridis]
DLVQSLECYQHANIRPPYTYAYMIRWVRPCQITSDLSVFHPLALVAMATDRTGGVFAVFSVYHGFSGEAANPERDLQLVHHQILLLQEQHGHLEERRETQPQPAQVLRESGGRKRSRVDGGRDRVPEEEGTEIPQVETGRGMVT